MYSSMNPNPDETFHNLGALKFVARPIKPHKIRLSTDFEALKLGKG